MIIKENYMVRFDGVVLEIAFSDQGLKIIGENGASYDSAVDPVEMNRSYIESRFLADDFEVHINYWLQKIHEGNAVIGDVPEAFRANVEERLTEEQNEQLTQAARILLGEED